MFEEGNPYSQVDPDGHTSIGEMVFTLTMLVGGYVLTMYALSEKNLVVEEAEASGDEDAIREAKLDFYGTAVVGGLGASTTSKPLQDTLTSLSFIDIFNYQTTPDQCNLASSPEPKVEEKTTRRSSGRGSRTIYTSDIKVYYKYKARKQIMKDLGIDSDDLNNPSKTLKEAQED